MSKISRHDLSKLAAAVGTGGASGDFVTSEASVGAVTQAVRLSWLGGQAPLIPSGIAWGVPWPRGAVPKLAKFVASDGRGNRVPVQSWPLAYWPDGSMKWTGLAIAADEQITELIVSVSDTAGPAPLVGIVASEGERDITIDTGPLIAVIQRDGNCLIESLRVEGRDVAEHGKLIVRREDRTRYAADGVIREDAFRSKVTKVTVEQSGPVRCVVRVEGVHVGSSDLRREWLPFSVRLYFTAGLSSVRMVHSFVFDGDQATDFIKGVGLAFDVPFREQIQNRHVRFATDHHNLFAEPVLMAPGYRPTAMTNAAEYQQAQLVGQRVPNLEALTERDRSSILGTPTWDSFKLTQLSADAWDLQKRTNTESSWLRITSGRRARGFAFVGDVSGGLGISLRRFWQKYPTAFEVTDASKAAGELKVWFWSPDAPAMDLRHYDTVRHSPEVTYEDGRDISRANAYGVANTSELTLWATSDTPGADALDAMAETGASPPLLICSPQHYHDTHTLGLWSLPGAPAPGLTDEDIVSADVQLDRAFAFLNGEIDRRRWYGFWDYGDWRRTFDPIRNQWMYDIGGHGWNATELMPNLWLWFAFLRTGQADVFRAAEDMTRNTLEVNVHHVGPFAGFGSRHNVSHWGDGAKEPRINMAHLKRIHYYLTTDERMGDLISEPLHTIEETLARVFNGHPEVRPPKSYLRIGPDWQSLASNWLVEWERTGDPKYRDYLLAGMRDIGAMPDALIDRDHFAFDPATKRLHDVGDTRTPGQFLFLFGGDQIVAELTDLIDCPEFKLAWDKMGERIVYETRLNWYYAPRVTAHAANTSGRQDLHEQAIRLYRGLLKFEGNDFMMKTPLQVDGPTVTQPGLINLGRSTFTPSLAVPEAAQWALNLITLPVLLRSFRPVVP